MVSQRVAEQAWPGLEPGLDRKPRPAEPTLVLFAGPPLAGKTTLARRLVAALPVATVHVENDRLRPRVAGAMGREDPNFDGEESHATYQAARTLVQRGLLRGLHAVHDATNLRSNARSATLEIAERLDRPAVAVFVQVEEDVRQARAQRLGPGAIQAHNALGSRQPDPDACDVAHVVVDGTRDPADEVAQLLATDPLEPLARGSRRDRSREP